MHTQSGEASPGRRMPAAAPQQVRFEAIGEGWQLMCQDFLPWVVTMLVVFGVTFALQRLAVIWFPSSATDHASPQGGFHFTYRVGFSVPLLIGPGLAAFAIGAAQNAMMTMPQFYVLRVLRGQPLKVHDMFDLNGRFWRLGVWWLIFPFIEAIVPTIALWAIAPALEDVASNRTDSGQVAIIVLAWIVCTFAFFAIQALFAFVPLLIVDGKLSLFRAAQLSIKTLFPHLTAMMMVLLFATICSALGFCACVVGILFTGALFNATIGIIYNDFFRSAELGGLAPVDKSPG